MSLSTVYTQKLERRFSGIHYVTTVYIDNLLSYFIALGIIMKDEF